MLPDSARFRSQQQWVAEDSAAGSHCVYRRASFPISRATTFVTHTGGNETFFADLLRYPSGNALIAVATNRANPNTRRASAETARLLFDASSTPRLVPGGERAEEPPHGPRASLLDRLLQELGSGNADALEALVRSDFSPRLAALVPISRHLDLLGSIRERSRGRAVVDVRPSDTEWRLDLRTPQGTTLTLLVLFDGADSARIGGLGLKEQTHLGERSDRAPLPPLSMRKGQPKPRGGRIVPFAESAPTPGERLRRTPLPEILQCP